MNLRLHLEHYCGVYKEGAILDSHGCTFFVLLEDTQKNIISNYISCIDSHALFSVARSRLRSSDSVIKPTVHPNPADAHSYLGLCSKDICPRIQA